MKFQFNQPIIKQNILKQAKVIAYNKVHKTLIDHLEKAYLSVLQSILKIQIQKKDIEHLTSLMTIIKSNHTNTTHVFFEGVDIFMYKEPSYIVCGSYVRGEVEYEVVPC